MRQMQHRLGGVLFALMAGHLPLAAAAENITLLADGNTDDWEYRAFDDIKETAYRAETDTDEQTALLADSNAGASGYILRRELDLDKTPWLHFLWRVDRVGDNPAEGTKAGDDYAWRLYFVGKSGITYRTLNFIYSQSAVANDTWESPYAGLFSDIYVYALAAHDPAAIGRWQTSRVNVQDVWRRLFGDDNTIGLVGLMSDGDSSGVIMQARYGKIVLSDSPDSPF